MKNKKNSKGDLGNVVESILSGPIQKKREPQELPTDLDSITHLEEDQPVKKSRSQKKKR